MYVELIDRAEIITKNAYVTSLSLIYNVADESVSSPESLE